MGFSCAFFVFRNRPQRWWALNKTVENNHNQPRRPTTNPFGAQADSVHDGDDPGRRPNK
jgi:hypothetical protein